ncbi:hypothetical protein KIW84_073762 [Lathyrus oleraceus]|uniref:Ubiquitin-like protease family profile domain-containing protein n=1 Tax=Pisum sativum TaxID=3888 RepID=A0A9D4ZZH2_PEA|nr:hypothetical protein KIW84_073762 [Pisum sativum]
MLKKAGKDIPTKSGTKTNPKSQKEVPGQMLDKASKEIPTTSGTKSQIMMRLEKMVEESDIMHGAIRSVDMDEGVFGIAHSELIAKEDMQQLFEHEELGIAVIHTYIWYMYDTLMRGTELCNRFNFIAASRINTTFITKNPTSVMNELVDRFMVAGDNTTPSLYFLLFNSGNGGHWVLVAMDLSRLMVYYLDSLPGNWSKYPSMKKTVDAAILKFRSKKNYRNRKDITWVRVQCPQQNNSIDCGFFVLRFMRDIIALNRIEIPKMLSTIEIYVRLLEHFETYLTQSTQSHKYGMSQTTDDKPTQNSEPFIPNEDFGKDSEEDLEEVLFKDLFGTIDDDGNEDLIDTPTEAVRAQLINLYNPPVHMQNICLEDIQLISVFRSFTLNHNGDKIEEGMKFENKEDYIVTLHH